MGGQDVSKSEPSFKIFKMAGETAVETPQQDNTIQDPVKTDKEAIVEEEKAAEQATEEKKDEEKKEEEPKKAAEPAKPKKPTTHVKEMEEDMGYLFQFTRSPQIPSISPFCLKLESWLKLHGIKYQNIDHKCKFRSRKGMLPFVEINGDEVADSNMIIETLAKKFDKEMPAQLSQDQKNVQHAMIAMLDLVVYSHVAQLVMIEKDYPCTLRDYLEADCKNLVGLVNRMKDRCWGDHWANATGEEMDLNPHISKPEPAPEPEPVEEKKEENEKEEDKKEDENKASEEKK